MRRRQMQKRARAIGLAVLFSMGVLTTTLCAAEEGATGERHRRDVSIHPVGAVHRMGDWIATRHMPKEQRQTMIAQRRTEREAREAQEKVKRDQRWAEKKAILDADKKR